MISELLVKNFKSIQELEIELGRVTVLIGANGCGKSNILEALALCSAASANKLDHEFLVSRGIRVPDDPHFMRSAFGAKSTEENITVAVAERRNEKSNSDDTAEEAPFFHCALQNKDNTAYSTWSDTIADEITRFGNVVKLMRSLEVTLADFEDTQIREKVQLFSGELDRLSAEVESIKKSKGSLKELQEFLIYSPENTSLRTFEAEGQIQPLGIKGEGLFKLLTVLSSQENKKQLEEIKKRLALLDWFDDFEVMNGNSTGARTLNIKDRYLDDSLSYFTQKSANEGFLFLLFYFTLFISKETPSFFAVDNIDASLNPKLCSQLVKELVNLAKTHNKQAIVTTHNPAILDGLDLNDNEQRLFVVSRNKLGHTKVKRITKQAASPDQKPVRLSEAFLRGYLGGLPGNF